MALKSYLASIKSSGIYRFVWNKSQIPATEAETLRLVVGYSASGPFNAPVYITSKKEFEAAFGEEVQSAQSYGNYFHKLANQALEAGPILALNLAAFDGEKVTGFQTAINACADKIQFTIDQIYNTNKFWSLEPERLMTNSSVTKYLAFTATTTESPCIFIRPAVPNNYHVTFSQYYSTKAETLPDYLEGYENEYVDDYFIEVYVFASKFSKELAKTPEYKDYFNIVGNNIYLKPNIVNSFGTLIDPLEHLSETAGNKFVNSYVGCVLPNFYATNGDALSIDTLINADEVSNHLMLALNTELIYSGENNLRKLLCSNEYSLTTWDETNLNLTGITGSGALSNSQIGDVPFALFTKGTDGTYTSVNKNETFTGNCANVFKLESELTINNGIIALPADFPSSSLTTGSVILLNDVTYKIVEVNASADSVSVSVVPTRDLWDYNFEDVKLSETYAVADLPGGVVLKVGNVVTAAGKLWKVTAITDTEVTFQDLTPLNTNYTVVSDSYLMGNSILKVPSADIDFVTGDKIMYCGDTWEVGFITINADDASYSDVSVGCCGSVHKVSFPQETVIQADGEYLCPGEGTKFEIIGPYSFYRGELDDTTKQTGTIVTLTSAVEDGTASCKVSTMYKYDNDNDITDLNSVIVNSCAGIAIGDYLYLANSSKWYCVTGLWVNKSGTEEIPMATVIERTIFSIDEQTTMWKDKLSGCVLNADKTSVTFDNLKMLINSQVVGNWTEIKGVRYVVGDVPGKVNLTVADYIVTSLVNFTASIGKNVFDKFVSYNTAGYQLVNSLANWRLNNGNAMISKLKWQDVLFNVFTTYPGLVSALCNKDEIDFRYIIDTFAAYPTEEVHATLSLIAKTKQNCLAILNFPAQKDFENCPYTSFTDADGKFNSIYIVKGGNPAKLNSRKFSLPSDVNGASYCGFFQPVKISGKSTETVPSAALVSNKFMEKFDTRHPYDIVAGPNYAVLTATGLTGPDYKYDQTDRDNLEPFGVNVMRYKNTIGTFINSNQTAKQNPVSTLSKINVRELCIYLQDEIEDLLQSYQWEFNTAQLRKNIKAKADKICEEVQANGGLNVYENICDETNNTDDVINNEMLVLSTSIEPGIGAGKMVQELTLYRHGGMSATSE